MHINTTRDYTDFGMIGWIKLSCLILFVFQCNKLVCSEDNVDGEVEDEEEETEVHNEESYVTSTSTDENQDASVGPSADLYLTTFFTQPVDSQEFIGGKLVKFLIGVQNRGERDFTFTSCEASFRYPLEFKYRIQNFTAVRYNRALAPKQEATFDYSFFPSEQFGGRSIGLVIELFYEDSERSPFTSTAFNNTIMIVEDDKNFSTETGFLYLVCFSVIVLTVLAAQHYFFKFTRKHKHGSVKPQQTIEVGANKNQVDFEWIPRNVKNSVNIQKQGAKRKAARVE